MTPDDFPAKLDLAMKALSIGRGRLAAELRVDKSVVGRWISGVNAPTGDNLARLSAAIATRRVGFTALDWESDLADFGRAFGVGEGAAGVDAKDWLPARVLEEAMLTTRARGDAYEGFWRSTRPSNDMPGRFIHDRIFVRKGGHGLLTFKFGVADMRFEGVGFPIQTQLFGLCADPHTGIFLFVILNGVIRDRADVLDGLSLTLHSSGGGAPVAAGLLLERAGLLSGDARADDERHEEMSKRHPLAPEGSVSENLAQRLNRDVAPQALIAAGQYMLTMPFATSLSRGPALDGALPA